MPALLLELWRGSGSDASERRRLYHLRLLRCQLHLLFLGESSRFDDTGRQLVIVFQGLLKTFAVGARGAGFLSPIMGSVVHNVGSVIVVIASASLAFKK